MEKIVKKIKQLRIYKGYSQEYIAEKIGISQRAYSKLENCHTRMTISRLNTIAKVLEVEVVDLMS